MEWFWLRMRLWHQAHKIEQLHQWYDTKLRDRFDDFPCRDCDAPEGMWW